MGPGGGGGGGGGGGRRGSRALRASLSLASPCRRVPASSRMALAVSCWARRKSREGSGAKRMGGGRGGRGGGLGDEGATWASDGGGGAEGGGDKARRGSWTVCRAGGGGDSRSLDRR
jgi:hypothetical protein